MATGELNGRAQQLLKTLIECYIQDGQPVGSRTLARHSELDLSPATIRNVMADLEELGLVSAPHTSAGRMPTAQGYRVFVNSLLKFRSLDSDEVLELQRQLDPQGTLPDLLGQASNLLSGLTKLAGLVTVPRWEQAILRHVEFIGLSEERVLAIFVINDSEVQNHVIHTQRRFTPAELEQAANYLNTHFVGKELQTVRNGLVAAMQDVKETVNALMQAAMEAAERVLDSEQKHPDYVLAGQTNLMGIAEFSNLDRLRQLFDAFAEKRDILHLLDQCLHSKGVQIFIGDESGYDTFGDCSLITAPYRAEGKVVGVLGVIGPTRMAYERVIPIVDITARLLGSALNSR
ncbi:MAG: heat-inducible transcriptional repressor HrcA [Gammaproteobacteria bacterium]